MEHTLEAWNEDFARSVVIGMTRRKAHLFAAFPEYEPDDLISLGLDAARAAWPRYNSKYKPSTFIYMVAARHLLTKLRAKSREVKRETAFAVDQPTFYLPSSVFQEWDTEQPMGIWLRGVYNAAKSLYGPRFQPRRGGRFYSVPQLIAIALLIHRLNLSLRGVRDMLIERKDLRQAIRMRRVPHHSWFERPQLVATLFFQKSDFSSEGGVLAKAS